MECNIDAKGKMARLLTGIAAIAASIVLCAIILFGLLSSTFWWYAAGAIAFGGAFAIFEAKIGWCVVRAIGFKTQL